MTFLVRTFLLFLFVASGLSAYLIGTGIGDITGPSTEM